MSRLITMHGASDDLVYIDGSEFDDDEYSANFGSATRFLATSQDGTSVCIINFTYTKDGTWAVCPSQADEDVPLPEWGFLTSQSEVCRYSAQLNFTVPDGVKFNKVS